MSVEVEYDATQHCTATRLPQGRTLAIDGCRSAGGRGEDFSPGDLLAAGLAGCMLFSMGVVARRDEIDIRGTRVGVDVRMSRERVERIDLTFHLPEGVAEEDRGKLERAAGMCPIKSSFDPGTKVTARFETQACCSAR